MGMLVHWSENQPAQCEVVHDEPQSHSGLGYGRLGNCFVSHNESIQKKDSQNSLI